MVAALLLLMGSLAARADLPELWPVALKAPQAAELPERTAALNDSQVPIELKTAVRFQQIFLKILSKPPVQADWVAEIRGLVAAERTEDPVSHGVAEVGRTWLARVNALKLDEALKQYYRHHVRFPERLKEIEPALPEELRRDPWGQPWAYKLQAPQGMAKLSNQRYQIGPALYPNLSPLKAALGDRNLLLPKWKIALQRIGDQPALEFRSANASATLQPGGKTGDYTLLYIGDSWALIASPDQLFALRFPN